MAAKVGGARPGRGVASCWRMSAGENAAVDTMSRAVMTVVKRALHFLQTHAHNILRGGGGGGGAEDTGSEEEKFI